MHDLFEDIFEGSIIWLMILIPLYVLSTIAVLLWFCTIEPLFQFLRKKHLDIPFVFITAISITVWRKWDEFTSEPATFFLFAGALLLCTFTTWVVFDVLIGKPATSGKHE
ncbi:MAG: hypothetical protein J6W22_07010 [Fibrobacter sp.]|nr:hypothetical protein [Fibrobacter sp.]